MMVINTKILNILCVYVGVAYNLVMMLLPSSPPRKGEELMQAVTIRKAEIASRE